MVYSWSSPHSAHVSKHCLSNVDVCRSSNIYISMLFKLTYTTKHLSLLNIDDLHQNNDNQMFGAQWEPAS